MRQLTLSIRHRVQKKEEEKEKKEKEKRKKKKKREKKRKKEEKKKEKKDDSTSKEAWHKGCFWSCRIFIRLMLVKDLKKRGERGFSLAEVLISLALFALAISGVIYGYTQVNRMSEYSSMSLAAQSYASQGLEQARSAQWDYVRWPNTNYGPGTGDELGFPPSMGSTNLPPVVDTLDVPTTGAPIPITNYVTISYVLTSINPANPPMRQIRSDCVWTYPLSGQICTNTAISLRAPDQ